MIDDRGIGQIRFCWACFSLSDGFERPIQSDAMFRRKCHDIIHANGVREGTGSVQRRAVFEILCEIEHAQHHAEIRLVALFHGPGQRLADGLDRRI